MSGAYELTELFSTWQVCSGYAVVCFLHGTFDGAARYIVNIPNSELFHQPTSMHNFLYSLKICLLHYYPRHVSSIYMPIFRRKNCIHTVSGIFALCKRLHSTLVESALKQCTVQTFTESEDTRCCVNTIFPPEEGHVNARNMSRIIV